MDLTRIFNVFSRRSQPAEAPTKRLTREFRNRVIQLFTTTFPVYNRRRRIAVNLTEFWSGIREQLLYIHGRQTLSSPRRANPNTDVFDFLASCSDEHFLDFIELVFQSESIWSELDPKTDNPVDVHALHGNVNAFLEVDDLPYYLTGFTVADGKIAAYPQVIRRDSEVLHESAIEPTLTLLSGPIFASANEEFLDALKDFRDGDYRDCVLKCGSSLESVMKLICDRRGWPYQQTDTAGPLLKHILPQTMLDSYFEHPIMLIATIRNRLSTAHGAGTQLKTVPKHVANYVINATASAILLLVDETNP